MTKAQWALAALGVAALAGGGTALAAKGRSHTSSRVAHAAARADHGPGDDLEAAATYLGTTASDLLSQLQSGRTLAQIAGTRTSGLIAALVTHEKQEIADAVAAGRLTQAQADQIVPTLTQRFTDLVNGTLPAREPGFRHHGPGLLDAAASYLGLSEPDLFTQLRAGKTLAEIATATSGRSTAGLIDALVAAAQTRFGGQVPPDLRRRITDLVNGTFPPHGPGDQDRHGFGPPGPNA
jgi:hypothetical protein